MTHYQELHVRDCILRSSMPKEINSFVEATESISVSGHPSKGEGGDFILESKNRRTKMWLPTGLPTEENWMRVCRNQDRLEKVHVIFPIVEFFMHPNPNQIITMHIFFLSD